MPTSADSKPALPALTASCSAERGQKSRPRPWTRRAGLAAVLLAVVVPAAACGDDDAGSGSGSGSGSEDETGPGQTTTSSTTTTTVADNGPCGLAEATDVSFPPGRESGTLHGVLTGSGPTAIVLAHESGEDACNLAFLVPELTADDRMILAFDFSGNGSSTEVGDGRIDLDVLAAVTEVRRRGATRVVVIGASMGGTAAVAAASTPDSGIDGVVSLSAGASFLHTDAQAGAANITIPVLFVAAENDGSVSDTAQALAEACGCAYPEVLVFDGSRHGRRLLGGGPDGEALRAAIDDLITHTTR